MIFNIRAVLWSVIALTFIFTSIVFSNVDFINIPNIQVYAFFSFLLLVSFLFRRTSSVNNIDFYFLSSAAFFLYSIFNVFVNTLIYFDASSTSNMPYPAELFFLFVAVFYFSSLLVLVDCRYSSLNSNRRILELFMSILSIHSFIVLILYILAVVGLNDFLLGVDDGYKFYRGFGLVTEPSYSSVISLVTAIFYFKKRAAIFSVSSVAFFLTFSGTAAISLLIVLIIWFVLSFGNWRLWLFLPVFIAVVFLIAHYNLVGFYEYQVARIVESLDILVSGGDISSLEYSNPRLMNFFNAIIFLQSYTLVEITFGKGVGSLIFLVGILNGTINFYPFQFIAEGGWVMIVFHLVSSLWLFLTIKGVKSRLIIVAIFSYWLINGGALFYMYYVLGPLLYYSKEGAESV